MVRSVGCCCVVTVRSVGCCCNITVRSVGCCCVVTVRRVGCCNITVRSVGCCCVVTVRSVGCRCFVTVRSVGCRYVVTVRSVGCCRGVWQEMNIVSLLLASCEADVVFGHMVEMAILVTRLVVEFAKHLPGFQMISKDDQIALLKASQTRDVWTLLLDMRRRKLYFLWCKLVDDVPWMVEVFWVVHRCYWFAQRKSI